MGYSLPDLSKTFKFSVAAQSDLGISARSNIAQINFNEEKATRTNWCFTDGDLMKAISVAPSSSVDATCLDIINKCTDFYGESLIDLDSPNPNNYVAMHFAAYFDYQLTLGRLIELGANTNARANDGTTPLYLTLTNSVKQTVSLNKLINVPTTDVNLGYTSSGVDPLIKATMKGYDDITSKILAAGGSVQTKTKRGNYNAIHYAASFGFDTIIEQLIAYKVDINTKDSDGETALMKAALYNKLSSVNALLIAGNQVNAQNKYGGTALTVAASNGFNDVVAQLLNKGADADLRTQSGNSALILAAAKNYANVCTTLLSYDAFTEFENENSVFALYAAADANHQETLTAMLSSRYNVDIDYQNSKGLTSLMVASDRGHLEAVKILLNKNADFTLEDNNGDTAL